MYNYYSTILNQTPEFHLNIRQKGFLGKVKSVQVEYYTFFRQAYHTLFYNIDGNLFKVTETNDPDEYEKKIYRETLYTINSGCCSPKTIYKQSKQPDIFMENYYTCDEKGLPYEYKEIEVKIEKSGGIGLGILDKHKEIKRITKHYFCEYNNYGQIIKKIVKSLDKWMPDTVYLFYYNGKHLIKRERVINNEVVGTSFFNLQPYEEGFAIVNDNSIYIFDENEILMSETHEVNGKIEVKKEYEHKFDEYGNCTSFKITQGGLEYLTVQKFKYY